jgi:hypothetical protein
MAFHEGKKEILAGTHHYNFIAPWHIDCFWW